MTSDNPSRRIRLATPILKANDRLARDNRERFAAAGVCAIDLIGSPGAGKTALLEATLTRLDPGIHTLVVTADIATSRDAERIAPLGVEVLQITTESFGGACHLEANSLGQALQGVPLERFDLLFIENVGNLICPAEFDLGQAARVLVVSVTEGEDKPLKYPLSFRTADLVVVSKTDLLPHLRVDVGALRDNLRRIRPEGSWLELSAQTGQGLEGWIDWLHDVSKRSR